MQSGTCPLSQQRLIDDAFMEMRAKIIDVAAFLDRMERSVEHNATNDFRMAALRQALGALSADMQDNASRVYAIQMIFSDPTSEPLERLDRKNAFGAFDHTREGR
jgi:hypothetical protein